MWNKCHNISSPVWWSDPSSDASLSLEIKKLSLEIRRSKDHRWYIFISLCGHCCWCKMVKDLFRLCLVGFKRQFSQEPPLSLSLRKTTSSQTLSASEDVARAVVLFTMCVFELEICSVWILPHRWKALLFNLVDKQPYDHTATQPYYHTAIQLYGHTTIQPYGQTTIRPHNHMTIRWHKRKKNVREAVFPISFQNIGVMYINNV